MRVKNLLTKKEVSDIINMNHYWEEVSKRDDISPLQHELGQIVRMLGVNKILQVLADYAIVQKENEDKHKLLQGGKK